MSRATAKSSTPSSNPAGTLPEVYLPRGSRSLADFSRKSGQILGPIMSLFMWQETVVEIIDEPWSSQPAQHRLALGGFKIHPMTAACFKGHFLCFIRPLAIVKKRAVFRNPNTTEMADLLENTEFQKHLQVLNRICPIPIPLLHYGKPVLVQSGYNPDFGIYCPGQLRPYRNIGLDCAKELLDKALSGFQFKTDQDRTHAIASILTPFLRGVIGFSEPLPCWFFKGNRPRVGKDYLAGVRQIIYEGAAFEDAAIGRDPEETRKRITAGLRAGRRMFHFANCEGHIHDRYLIQAVTNTIWRTRGLGSDNAASDLCLPNEAEYSFSGTHDVTYSEHLEPRLREIELVYYEEDPNGRTFANPQLHDWVKLNRLEMLDALWTFFMHWIKEGQPKGGTFTSFEAWARVVGGVMQAVGLGDPAQPRPNPSIGGNLKEIAMKAVFEVGHAYAAHVWTSKNDIYDQVAKEQAAGDSRLDHFGDLSSIKYNGELSQDAKNARTKLGQALNYYEKCSLSGIRLMIDKSSSNSSRWKLLFPKA